MNLTFHPSPTSHLIQQMTVPENSELFFSRDNLVDIYKQKIGDTETVGIDRVHPKALGKVLENEVQIILNKVHAGTYHFTPYKEVLLIKGAGSPPRTVSAPTARDRIVLRALYQLLAKSFPEAISKVAQLKIANIIESMAHFDNGEFIKVDIRHFYPTVDQKLLLKKIAVRVTKPEILLLIERAIQTATVPVNKGGKCAEKNVAGVPQGIAISNILAEIFMLDFDKAVCLSGQLMYQRYVDDILILCPPEESGNIFRKIHSELGEIGLTPHALNAQGSKSKSASMRSEFDFLGYRFNDGLVSVRRQSILKLESSFANTFTAYRHKINEADTHAKQQRARAICEWRLNLRITGCIFEGKRLGWLFYFSQITDLAKLRAIDHTVDNLLNRFHLKGQIKVKRLLKSYHECKRIDNSSHSYIINFDNMAVNEQRQLLALLTGHYQEVQKCSDEKISELFKLKIRNIVQELKSDLAEVY